jgi:hypothetical protein
MHDLRWSGAKAKVTLKIINAAEKHSDRISDNDAVSISFDAIKPLETRTMPNVKCVNIRLGSQKS